MAWPLGILGCHCCGLGSIPSPGTSSCRGIAKKKKKVCSPIVEVELKALPREPENNEDEKRHWEAQAWNKTGT